MAQISIITVTRNSADTLVETLQSLYSQSLFQQGEVEHIVIDGDSTDQTLEILKKYSSNITTLVSEPDDGIYDAMNKGIALAHSNIIGILNSDDVYETPSILENVAKVMNLKNIDLVYADLVYFKSDAPKKITRRYRSNFFRLDKFSYGLMPAHPTIFVRRSVYENLGVFDSTFRIAGDFDWLARVFKSNSVSILYIPEVFLRMRTGGQSSSNLRGLIIKNREILRSCTKNKISTSYLKICLRFFGKALESFRTK
jgi:glycosyltransferase involved in cell wall biosynthesis